jgi:hypothetical protein
LRGRGPPARDRRFKSRQRRRIGEVDVDPSRRGQFEPAGAEPRLQELCDFIVADAAHVRHARQSARGLDRSLGLSIARDAVGLDDLDRHTPGDLVAKRARGPGKREARGGSEHGQEDHDRDHPRHRAGRAPFRQQAPVGGREGKGEDHAGTRGG